MKFRATVWLEWNSLDQANEVIENCKRMIIERLASNKDQYKVIVTNQFPDYKVTFGPITEKNLT